MGPFREDPQCPGGGSEGFVGLRGAGGGGGGGKVFGMEFRVIGFRVRFWGCQSFGGLGVCGV